MRRRRFHSPACRTSQICTEMPIPTRNSQLFRTQSTTIGDNAFQDPQSCPVCLDTFDRNLKPPKLLPCGHSFCNSCLFSLCLHREYYLLDTVKCPRCKKTFDAQCAIEAPTNLDLCNLMENTQSSQNVTVIHVGGASNNLSMLNHQPATQLNSKRNSKASNFIELTRDKSESSIFTAPSIGLSKSSSNLSSLANTTSSNASTSLELEYVVDLQDNSRFCFDCRRYVDIKERAILCRFCASCHGTAKKARLTCLECCVNRHNGHQLKLVEELEVEQERFINDLRILQAQRQKFGQLFESKLHSLTIQANGKGHTEFLALDQAQKLITHELDACIQKAYTRIQHEQLLHPNEVRQVRQKPFILLARLQRLANLLEQAITPKSNDNPDTFCPENQENDRLIELRQALQCLCTLVAFQTPSTTQSDEENAFEDVRQYIVLLCSDECAANPAMRSDVLKSCVRALNSVLYGLNRPELLLLFEDALLNCFMCLNALNPRFFGKQNIEREKIWKLVQTSFSELLRLFALQWLSANENRVQVVSDFARLCSLFGDVCDSSTVTLCTIEAVRARSAFTNQPISERFGALEAQLQQIDEHIQEIHRVQKLAKLCVRSRLKRRHKQPVWLSCFSPRIK